MNEGFQPVRRSGVFGPRLRAGDRVRLPNRETATVIRVYWDSDFRRYSAHLRLDENMGTLKGYVADLLEPLGTAVWEPRNNRD